MYVDRAVQTSPVEEHPPHTPPALCHDLSSNSSTPAPDSDGDDTYAAKGGLKRKKSITQTNGPQAKKVRSSASPPSQVKPVVAQKQARRETVLVLEGAAPKRSIYAPSPTPLQCNYVYPIALGPPRRPIDLRRTKGAKAMPDASVSAAVVPVPQAPAPATDSTASATAPNPAAPAEPAPMEVDDSHKHTHRCPITFSREFEMRRHIRTVHIAEEIRAVVEGRLPRAEATVIPDSWDGKTLLMKPTCTGCGTTFSRPDAVRRHQTEVNAKMENGVCIECPGPKVHIRRGPRKDVHHPGQSPVPVPVLAPVVGPAAPTTAAPGPMIPSVPAVAATPAADAPNAPVAPTSADSQPQQVVRERAEPAEGELESEDDM
ncbi:hypothetical protein BDV93DRAFT_154930 [Ceratobasidium sp. AG-I]|nr:hypothetical protein BDV93DRAFT_154930 [Ceratobasidium sp. AG-I]